MTSAVKFDILRALEATPVRAPRALWIEETGDVLGRPFYVMERLAGEVFEREIPPHLKDSPERIATMSEHAFDQIIAIHQVDLRATGLDSLGDGRDYLDRELDHWAAQMHRWQRGTLPALERLLSALRDRQPDQCPTVTLVHGDPKPGNFAFVDDDVTGVFDWEMASVGDPLADLGWAEMTWRITTFFAGLPASHFDGLLAHYERTTGTPVQRQAVVLRVPGIQDGGHPAGRWDALRPGIQRRSALRRHGDGRSLDNRARPSRSRHRRAARPGSGGSSQRARGRCSHLDTMSL